MRANITRYIGLLFIIYFMTGCVTPKVVMSPGIESFNHKGIKVSNVNLRIDSPSHTSLIDNIIISKKTNEIITSSRDDTIKVRNAQSLKEKRKILGVNLTNMDGIIYAMALSPDTKTIVFGGAEATYTDKNPITNYMVRVYNYSSGKTIKMIHGVGYGPVQTTDFSSDGKYLVISYLKGVIVVYDTKDYKQVKKITFPRATDGEMKNIEITKIKDDYIIFIITEGVLRKYSLKKGFLPVNKKFSSAIERSILGEKSKKIILSFAIKFKKEYKNGKFKLVNDNRIVILDYDFNILKSFDTGHVNTAFALSKDEKHLVVGSTREGIDIYNINTTQKVNTYKKHTGRISALKFYGDSTVYSVGGEQYEIQKWDINKLIPVSSIKTQTKPIYDIAVTKNKTIAWSYVKDKQSKKYTYEFDIRNFRLNKLGSSSINMSKEISNRKPYSRVKNDKYILGFSQYGRVHLNKLNGGNVFRFEHNNFYTQNSSLGFFKNNLIIANDTGSVDILDFKGNVLGKLIGHQQGVYSYTVLDNFFITASKDHTIKFWDLSEINKGKALVPLATLLTRNDEWILWTPEGFFTASENALDLIGYHINGAEDFEYYKKTGLPFLKEGKWVSIEAFYDHFFRPDLVKMKLSGHNIKDLTNNLNFASVLKNQPPKVTINKVGNKSLNSKSVNHKKRKVTLKFTVNEVESGGIGLIRIYQEGKLVKTIGKGKINRKAGNAQEELKQNKLDSLSKKRQKEFLNKSLSKSVGNILTQSELVAPVLPSSIRNEAGIYSVTLPLKAGKNSIAIEAFNKTNTVLSIRESININAKIKKRTPKVYAIVLGVNNFEQSSVGQLKYSENDATTIAKRIKNATNYKTEVILLTGKKVTKKNLEKAIAKVKKKAHLEDKVIFYISTHGKAYKGRLYLVPQNNKRSEDWINFEDLFKGIQSIAALDQIFVIDACESGQASDIMSSVYDAKASVLAKQSGVHVLMATTKGTFAFESPDPKVKHGVFTNNILKALDNKKTDKNKNGWVSVVELSKILQEPANNTQYQFPIIRNVGQDTNLRKLR